jgi:homeobox protein cut-like
MNVLLSFSSAPDPVAALDAAISTAKQAARQRDLEFENRKLVQELDEYRREHSDIQNQAVTVARLRERVRQLEGSVDSLASERAKAREMELQNEGERVAKQFKEKEQLLARRVAQAEQQVAALQRSNDDTQSQLFDLSSKRDDELAALQSEIDLLSQELDKRVVVETQLRGELSAALAASNGRTGASATTHDIERQLAARDEELASTRDQVLALDRRLESELSRYHDRLATLTKEQREAEERARDLQTKLAAAPSTEAFATLQRQVDVFRSLGYDVDAPATGGENRTTDSAVGSSSGGGGGTSDIERVLRDTIRQRESAAAAAQVAKVQAEQRAIVAEQRIVDTEAERTRLQALVGKLEADLALRLASSDVLQLAGVSSNAATLPTDAAFAELKASDGHAVLISGVVGGATSSSVAVTPLAAAAAATTTASAPSPPSSLATSSASVPGAASENAVFLLQVVCAQRDRLQQRVIDLEAEGSALLSGREHVTEEAKQLREDNVKLYEKIRYLESYSADLPDRRRRRRDLEAATSSTSGGVEHDDVERRYRPLYEAAVSPFAQFATSERERRYGSLSGVERVVMWASSIFLRNKTSRFVLFFYLTALHVMVFVVLNRYASTPPSVHVVPPAAIVNKLAG